MQQLATFKIKFNSFPDKVFRSRLGTADIRTIPHNFESGHSGKFLYTM